MRCVVMNRPALICGPVALFLRFIFSMKSLIAFRARTGLYTDASRPPFSLLISSFSRHYSRIVLFAS